MKETYGCPFCKKKDITWVKKELRAYCSSCNRELIANNEEELSEKINIMINMYRRMYPPELG